MYQRSRILSNLLLVSAFININMDSNTHIPKLIGVRRVKKEVDENSKMKQAASKKFVFKHGIENPFVQYLMINHPCLLGKVLSMRYYEKQEHVSDFVTSFLKHKGNRDPRRKRSFATMSKSQSTGERGSSINDDSMVSSFDMLGNFDLDVITEEESMFLMDVLEEIGHDLGKRDTDRADSNVDNQCVLAHNCSLNSNTEEATDDLVWLTNEMEAEWRTFKLKAEKIQSLDVTNNLHSIINSPESSSGYNHRVYLSIGRGNRCDVGLFESAVEASTAYDAYALGRRLVGLKAIQEYRVRKRLKARRYSYEATQVSLLRNQ